MSRAVQHQAELIQWRTPMRVTHIFQLPSGDAFPVCPACQSTLEREYQRYCDRCGQRLGWKHFCHAAVISWPNTLPPHGLGEAITFPGEDHDVGMVDEPVNQGGGEAVISEDGVPLAELQIGGDDEALSLVAV